MARITEIRRILATASNVPKRISHHSWSARKSSHKPNSELSSRNMSAISLTSILLAWGHNKTKLFSLACHKKILCSPKMSTITARRVQGIQDRCRMLGGQLIMAGRICFRFIRLEIIRQTSTPAILQTRTQAEANLRATGRSSSSAIPKKTLSSSNSNKCLRMLLKSFIPASHRIRYPHTILSNLKCSIRLVQRPAAVKEEETLPCRIQTRLQIAQSQSSSPHQTSSSSRLTFNRTFSQVMNPISSTVTSRQLIAVRRLRHQPRSRARSSLKPPSARS